MLTLIEPNIHPVLVHFAYALSTTAAASLFVVAFVPSLKWRDSLRHAGDWMLAFGTLAIIATVAAGFQAYYTVAHDGPAHEVMTIHRNWAVSSALSILILAAWRWVRRHEMPSRLFAVLLLAGALALTTTAWWGGKLVYGHGIGVSSLPKTCGNGHDHNHSHAQNGSHNHDHGDCGENDHDSGNIDGHDHDVDGDMHDHSDMPGDHAMPDIN